MALNMMNLTLISFLALACLWTIGVSAKAWPREYEPVNGWRGDAKFSCGQDNSKYLAGIFSYHSNKYEDRKFKYQCKEYKTGRNRDLEKQCTWTGFVNSFDRELDFMCDEDSFINGMNSTFSKHRRDRRFSIQCCKVKNQIVHKFKVTDYLNDWDRDMLISLSRYHGRVIVGIRSYHNNKKEDRRSRFVTASLTDKKSKKTYYSVGKPANNQNY